MLAATLASVTLWGSGLAVGDPADVFTIGAPAIGSDPPKASSIAAGDASVSTQTGAFEYGYPIEVPPGRNGMQPKLSLSYSSQGAIYGGIANGWSLPVPMISLDTSAGRLWQESSGYRWISSLAGGHPLVPVTETAGSDVGATFRAKNDATFTRYEQIARGFQQSVGVWRARTSDGMTYHFGQWAHVDGSFTGTAGCSAVSLDYAPLTQVADSFGNAIDYYYETGVAGECRLAAITWGQNAAAGITDFARISLNYSAASSCAPGTYVGAQTSYRDGNLRVMGASELDSIVVTAYSPGQPGMPVHTRTITLGYTPPSGGEQTAACGNTHAPYRSLYSIQETAVGIDSPQVTLPPVTFTYGSAQFGSGALMWSQQSPVYAPWSWVANNPSIGAGFNLGWGYRFDTTTSDGSRWPTVEAMMVDIDGDGLVDRLVNAPLTSGNYTCHAQWMRNKGNFQFEGPRDIPLPTLKWATPQGGSCMAGATSPNQYSSPDYAVEGCALNYQRTNYTNSLAGGAYQCHTRACGPNGYCDDTAAADYGTSCNAMRPAGPTYLAYRWVDLNGDGLVDLIASPASGGRYNFAWGDGTCGGAVAPQEPSIFGGFPRCPSLLYSDSSTTSKSPTMCGRMYPWIVYLNKGNGKFGKTTSSTTTPVPDTITYQPIPLETDSGDSSLTASPLGQDGGTLDLDGDGYPDAVGAPHSSSAWNVFRNDTNGVLGPDPATGNTPFTFEAFGYRLSTTDYQTDAQQHISPISSSGLLDLNGDGMTDLWTYAGSDWNSANVYWNDGQSVTVQTPGLASVRPGNDGKTSCYQNCTVNHPVNSIYYFSVEAQRSDSRRVIDADLDGRPDVMTPPQGALSPTLWLNQGGNFGGSCPAHEDPTALAHSMVVTDQMAPGHYTWEIRSDMLDVDGDGIPEGVSFADHTTSASSMTVSKIPTPTSPPRLMTNVANGRGATTTVAYAPITDPATVTRDPGVVMPRTQWVVKSLTTSDSFAATTSTTAYAYKNPHYSAEGDLIKEGGVIWPQTVVGPSKNYAFRGFDEVTTTGPSGAKTVDRYRYDVDWSGRLATTLVIPAEAPGEVRSIEDTTWEPRYLFCDRILGCALKTYHATKVDHWTCKNGQSEATCRTNTDTVTESVATLSELQSTTAPGSWPLWKETSSRLSSVYQASPPYTAHEGDRVTDSTYIVASDATNYRLLPSTEIRSVITNGTPVPFSEVAHTYDPNKLVAVTDDVWLAADGSSHAITDRVYDMQTGLVVQTRRPNQHAANGAYTISTYDARKLFPAKLVNELGHELDFTYEYGTGTKLDTQGPNTATCVATSTCPAGSSPKQDHRIRVDGIGRTIETYDTFSNSGSSFATYKTATDSYIDGAPSSATHQQAIDLANGAPTYNKTTVTLDGHGRPTRSTSFVFGAAPVDAVTTYQYANDGTLASVTVPDPSVNNASTVTYTYTYDSLGRPTTIRRPDSAVLTSRSGMNMSYDGLTVTTAEYVSSGDGKPSTTRTTHDMFGRLVKVEEALSGAPVSSWAATVYGYDAADRITKITDSQNVTTSINYDFGGRRTGVVRPGATWTFTYFVGGNVASLTTPNSCAVGDSVCAARYVTTYAYDALDRLTTKQVAHRDLTSTDLNLFAVDTEKSTWDACNQSPGTCIGQLTQWRASGPAGVNPQTLTYRKDAQGRDVTVSLSAKAEGATFSRSYQEQFALNGVPNYFSYHDSVGGTNATTAKATMDARGLPLAIVPTIGGVQGAATMGTQTRNVAGLVTSRRTNQTGAMTFVESNWTYDKLGRVASQIVEEGPGPVRVAEQDLAYFGNDDPKTLDQYLGAGHKQLVYGYDYRHQLTSARESTTSGAYFNGTYTYGNAGRFKTAIETATAPGVGSEVTPRNVTYTYAGTDPEQVTALTSGTTTFASYAYDQSGNQISRCTGGASPCASDSVEYVYDGADRLRRATAKHAGVVQAVEEYWYGDKEQRIATVKLDASAVKAETIVWLRDTEAHYDGANTLTNIYTYLTLGTAVARVNRTGNTTASIEYDFHGLANNTLAAVDASGTVNASFSYAPFGELVESTNAGGSTAGVAAHPRRMNDKYIDAGTGLAYYGARFYDKTLIGWTQMDPLYRFVPDAAKTSPRRRNLYSFVVGNPLRYLDPDGRDVWSRGANHWDHEGVGGSHTAAAQRAWAKENGGAAVGGGSVYSWGNQDGGVIRFEVVPVAQVSPAAEEVVQEIFDLVEDCLAGNCTEEVKSEASYLYEEIDAAAAEYNSDLSAAIDKAEEIDKEVGEKMVEGGEALFEPAMDFSKIGSTGEVGEHELSKLGGIKRDSPMDTPFGFRFVDRLIGDAIHESKVGYTPLSDGIRQQVFKDAFLLNSGQVSNVTWHFFESPVTGQGGPAQLQGLLEFHGFTVTFHF